MPEKLKQQLAFLAEADKMKSIFRQTVLTTDRSRNENDAEHSWHFALMAMTLFEYNALDGVDLNRVIKMALVHDLVEIYAGDTFAFDEKGNETKAQRENEAADKLFALLPKEQAEEYKNLWVEFDGMETPDAIYANTVDRLQSFFMNSLTEGHTWVKHNTPPEKIFKRMEPVKTAMPRLWGFVEEVVKDCIK
jgi:putative hydrolase of HD superfamily